MAEGVAFNIAESLLKQAGALALQEIGKIRGVEGELTELGRTATRIQQLFLDAEEEEEEDRTHQDKQWLEELKKVVYVADDLLDDFATEVLRRQAMGGSKVVKMVRIFFSRSNQLVYGRRMAGSIEGVRAEMKRIAGDRVDWRLDVTRREKARLEETDSSPPNNFVGREGDRDDVIKLLMAENREIVSLVGVGGIGKTALAQVVFHHESVGKYFDLAAWVYASDPFDVMMVAKKILESITCQPPPDVGLNAMLQLLGEKLAGKRFLVVLDDVWSNEKWGDIWKLLKKGAEGSKILVTTRFIEVARIAGRSFHRLDCLSSADSLSLLLQTVFGDHHVKTYIAAMGEKIVRNCDGVPRAIESIGNQLRLNDPETEWPLLINQDPLAAAGNENVFLATLRSNYNHLPLHLKQCFAYCSLFPKDYVIDVKSLIHLWVAQGFVTKSSDETQMLEDIGSKYFVDLSRRSFFEDVEKDTLGMVKSCKLSHLMHRLATTVASTECKMVSKNVDRIASKVHHVSLNFDLEPPQGTPNFLSSADQLRTFLLPAQGSSSTVSRTWDDSSCTALVSCFKRLRVFDLHNTGIENLSPSIKRLKQVRFLDMSQNGIKLLPRSICKLQNLQVLKLSHCREITELPKDIVKLVGLQHIYCEGCVSLIGMPIGLGGEDLTSLQTLTWFVVSKDGGTKPKHIGGPSVLKKLNNLRGRMEIRNLGWRKASASEFKDANMAGKEFLQSLTLRWNGGDETTATEEAVANYDEEALSGLQPHQNLKELQVYSYGGVSFPGWLSSMTNLVNIRVDGCQRCKSLPPLSSIHSLRELFIIDLIELEYIVNENLDSVNRGKKDNSMFFPSLKTLLLLNCPKLKGWKKGTGDDNNHDAVAALPRFPCLSKLEVRNCPELTSLPQLPAPDGRLSLKNTGNLEPAKQLMKIKMTMLSPTSQGLKLPSWLVIPENLVEIWITDCKGCELLPAFDQIAFLKDIYLGNLPDSKYIDIDDDNSQGEGLVSFPFLKNLWIWDCPKLKGWQKKGGNGGNRKEFPQFSCLSFLEIRRCPELSWMPEFPNLQERFYFINAGVHSYPNTLSFTNLQVMSIEEIPELEFIDLNGDSYITGSAQSAPVFPFLKTLWILNCPKLKGWWKMTDDEARNMKRQAIPQLPRLSFLEIRHCPELSWMPEFPNLQERFYFIEAGVRSYPNTLSFTNLQVMSIEQIPELEFLDLDGDSYITGSAQSAPVFPFLKTLWILNCPKLKGWWKMTDDEARNMKREAIPQLPRLSFLEIRHCPELSWMPEFPNLQERFYFIEAGVRSYPNTLSFTNLQVMSIEQIPELEFLDLDGDSYITGSAQSAPVFPFLKTLWILNCPKLKGWWKMTDDEAQNMKREAIPQLPRLSFLEIRHCPELSWMPAFPNLQEKLVLDCTSAALLWQTMKMTTWAADSSSPVHPLSKLKVLHFKGINDLDSLPEEWLQNLIFLETLYIESCLGLTSLPKGMCHLASLKDLEIWYCPQLTERCERNNGKDWPSIGHIPQIKINGKQV